MKLDRKDGDISRSELDLEPSVLARCQAPVSIINRMPASINIGIINLAATFSSCLSRSLIQIVAPHPWLQKALSHGDRNEDTKCKRIDFLYRFLMRSFCTDRGATRQSERMHSLPQS